MSEEGQNQPKIASKRIKFHESEEKGEENGINALQECLLLEILSRLPSTKDAIRTAALSRRWKHLWKSVPTLIFKHSDDPLTKCRRNPNSRSDFLSFVEKTLTQCRQLKLKKFQVFTSYRFTNYHIRFEAHVNNWIRYAMSCNVEEVKLEFLYTGRESAILLDQFFFINSSFTDLRLSGCKFNPTGSICWKNLRSLCIFHGKLDEDLIENILSGSPLLETLELGECYGYKRLDITSKSLKNLVFTGYFDPNNEVDEDDDFINIIGINAPNILSLTIKGNMWLLKLLLVNVSSLVEANLDYTFMGHWEATLEETEEEILETLIPNLHHVKELKIGSFCSKVVSRLEAKGFIFPSNTKLPDVTCDWSDSDSDW